MSEMKKIAQALLDKYTQIASLRQQVEALTAQLAASQEAVRVLGEEVRAWRHYNESVRNPDRSAIGEIVRYVAECKATSARGMVEFSASNTDANPTAAAAVKETT